jgi:hypothetical protein
LDLKSVSLDIINAVDLLYTPDNQKMDSHNPVSELITPEWHYSDSFQILDNIQISWDNLGEFGLIKAMTDSLEKAKIPGDTIAGTEFERSICSWYQPYHYLPRQKWGVHLRYDSWMRVAALFYHSCPSTVARKLDSIKSAFLYLYAHELFHNIVENAASVMEIVLSDKSHIYRKYYSNVYSEVFNSSNCIEEALSNGYLFLWAKECHMDRDFLKGQLLKQGPGYHNFIQYIDSNFSKGNRILLSQIRHGDLNPTTYHPIEQLLDISDPVRYSSIYNVPIWLHRKPKPVH